MNLRHTGLLTSRGSLALALTSLLLTAAVPAAAEIESVMGRIADSSRPRGVDVSWAATCIYEIPTCPTPPPGSGWGWVDPTHWGRFCGENLPLDDAEGATEIVNEYVGECAPVGIRGILMEDGHQALDYGNTASRVWVGSSYHYSASFWGKMGSADGWVRLPGGTPVPPGGKVFAYWHKSKNATNPPAPSLQMSTTVNGQGYFEFTIADDPAAQSNHWVLSLFSEAGGWPEDVTYSFFYTPDPNGTAPTSVPNPFPGYGSGWAQATLRASSLATVYITYAGPLEPGPEGGDENPEKTPEEEPPPASPCDEAVGKPIAVATGNVYVNQTDMSFPGIRTWLDFTRTYNSYRTLTPGSAGAFGRGWDHAYDKRVVVLSPHWIRLEQGSGLKTLFSRLDPEQQTFTANTPASETSWIVQTPEGYTRHFKQGGLELYDTQGLLSEQVDRVGNRTIFTRENGLLTAITLPGGRGLTLTYSGARIHELFGPDAQLAATYTYEGDLLKTVTYRGGGGYTISYDERGLLLSVTDATGRVLEKHTYTTDGRGRSSEIADRREEYTLTYAAGSTEVRDSYGNKRTYTTGRRGGVLKTLAAEGACGSCGTTETRNYTYDDTGRLTDFRDATDRKWKYAYDPQTHWLSSVTSAEGTADAVTVNYTYDEYGRVRTVSPPPAGSPLPGDRTVTFTYEVGGVVELAGPRHITNALGTTEIKYFTDGPHKGLVEWVKDPMLRTVSFGYNDFGDLISIRDGANNETTIERDSFGRATLVRNPLTGPAPQTPQSTRYEFDDERRGRVKKVTYRNGETDLATTQYTYDTMGRLESVTDPAGRVTSYGYDPYGRLTVVRDPNDGVTTYGYDLMSHLASITDTLRRKTTFQYDDAGRLERVVYPGNRAERYTFDEEGRVLTKTDRRSKVTSYTYDGAGRPTGKTYSDGTQAVIYTYEDVTKRLHSVQNGADTVTWTWGLADELRSEESTANGSTVSFVPDASGARASLTLGGNTLLYDRDPVTGWLDSITRGTASFVFDDEAAFRRSALHHPNGLVTNYEYLAHPVQQLTLAEVKRGLDSISKAAYTYDVTGNRTSRTTLAGSEQYAYDRLSRLVEAVGADQASLYGFDAVGNRVNAQTGDDTTQSTVLSQASYNERNEITGRVPSGRLTVKGTVDEPATVTVNGQTAQFVPDEADNLWTFQTALQNVSVGGLDLTVVATDTDSPPQSTTEIFHTNVTGSAESYEYDLNGNLEERVVGNDTWTYEWTVENELKLVKKNAVTVAEFKYDGLGRRIEKVAGNKTHRYTYDGMDIIREIITDTGGTTTYLYLHGPGIDEPLARIENPGTSELWTYYHADGLGSITKITNSAGEVVKNYQYDPWGNIQCPAEDPTCADEGGYRFTGREWDPETGLYYYRARYYDPKIGRFISEDPIGFAGGVNFYAYVYNNPAILIDPFGLAPYVDKYGTVREAGMAAVADYNPRSKAEDREYGGAIYRNPDGTYSYTAGRRGRRSSCDINTTEKPNLFGIYHTHGAHNLFDDDSVFSSTDIDRANELGVPSYLGTPFDGVLEYYTPTRTLNVLERGR